MKQFKPVLWTVGAIASITLAGLGALYYLSHTQTGAEQITSHLRMQLPMFDIKKEEIAAFLGKHRFTTEDLAQVYYPITLKDKNLQAKLTIDRELQEVIENIYAKYDPAYAAFVAMDPSTGKILAIVDHSYEAHTDNLALQATYPAASVFKVVTSAAALEEKKLLPQSRIPFNGATGTLYRKNLTDNINRWTRYISVEEALAKSVNTVFAKIAINRLGPQTLQKYANSFGFNQKINFELPLDSSSAIIPDDNFGLAESGSGYTKRQTLSPVQGAMLASAVINGGAMPNPIFVESLQTDTGAIVYEGKSEVISRPLDSETARALSLMMENTVTLGTGRKQFRDYNHHPVLSKLFIGAKTGSLSGEHPEGRYDWFVGFAQASDNPTRKLAFASLIINRQVWKVKAAHVAREAIIQYFKNRPSSL